MVPDDLSGEFRFVESLVGEDANAVLLVEALASGGRQVLKLLPRSAFADDRFHQELHRRARTEGNRLNIPARTGRVRDGRYFTLTDYRANGSVHSCLSGGTPLPGGAVRPLVRDTARALEQLHEETHGLRVVHGDIKPSNVLVVTRGEREADWEFRLSDFDSSILLQSGCPGAPASHTAAYAAPEVLRTDTAPDVAMDYWSMGMLLLASLLGRHPFGDLPDDQVTDLLVNQEWTIDPGYLSRVQDESCRALLGGLLRRVPEQRWGADEVRQWIEGEPEIVARGLRLLGENAADDPFPVNGEYAYTVSNLAIALLRSWNTDLLLGSGDLSGWLRRLSPGAADHLEGIRRREVNADAALLDFCGTYHPGERMPPVWRGEEVSARNFARLAARANDGDHSARSRLLAFLQPDGHRYFTSRATYPDVASLVESIGLARGEYLEAWQTIAGANGPRSMSSDEESWIHAALIACSPVDEEDHRARIQEIFDPLLVMRRADWFLAFGTDPDRINPSQLFVLRSLQQASLLEDVDIAHLDGLGNFDARRLREGIVLPESQRRLLEELTVRPGARIDRVEAGETYAPERSPSLKDVVADGMGRGFRWCHARLRRRGEEPRRPREDSRVEMRMRIVRLTIKATRLPVGEEDELYLALISWTGAGPGARLFVANPSTVFPVPRFQTQVTDEGRMLLVIDRDAQVHLQGRGLGFPGFGGPSIRILTGRKYPAPVRVPVRDVASHPVPVRSLVRGIIKMTRGAVTEAGSFKGRLYTRMTLPGTSAETAAGSLLGATGRIPRIRLTPRQWEQARRRCADLNVDWSAFARYARIAKPGGFLWKLRRRAFRMPAHVDEKTRSPS